jgi:hypothetical protein
MAPTFLAGHLKPAPDAEITNANGQKCAFFQQPHFVIDLTQINKNN